MQPDFDFKTRTGHMRGYGWRGLVALLIVRVPLGTAVGVGIATAINHLIGAR